MGRFWIGTSLLVIFLVLGLWVGATTEQTHSQIAQLLEQAAQQTVQGHPEEGAALAEQAAKDWESHRKAVAAVADHAPMEVIDSRFAQLQIFQQQAQHPCFAASCAELAKLVEAVGEAHKLTWWNLL